MAHIRGCWVIRIMDGDKMNNHSREIEDNSVLNQLT